VTVLFTSGTTGKPKAASSTQSGRRLGRLVNQHLQDGAVPRMKSGSPTVYRALTPWFPRGGPQTLPLQPGSLSFSRRPLLTVVVPARFI